MAEPLQSSHVSATVNMLPIHAMIADFNHDKTSDGGTAAMTFMSYESIGMNLMENSGKVANGWDTSTMRNTTLNNTYSGLDSDLRTNIIGAIKKSIDSTGTQKTTTDNLFIPSVEELHGVYQYTTKP